MILFFLLALLLLAAAAGLLRFGILWRSLGLIVGGAVALLLAVAAGAWSFTYAQTTGEVKVVKTITGTVEPATHTTGLHPRAPWDTVYTYPTLNNVASFVGDGTKGHDGNEPTGPQITVQDKDGVTANVDVQVDYSVDPAKIDQIHERYRAPEAFTTRVINVAIRDAVRQAPAGYSTIEVLTKRGEVAADVHDALVKKLESDGVIVESVSVQEVRYPKSVTERFAEAQAASTEVEKAKQEAERAEIEAKGKATAAIEEAKGQAKANELLTKSLTPEVLKQREISALEKAGAVYVVPEGSQPMVGVPSTGK